tara:strand:- start:352 stop:564 length:213 start_codon:yes stop_codon:yes gene_type:complete
MQEIDDTEPPESESECPDCAALRLILAELVVEVRKWPTIEQGQKALALRVANLETQRTPQDENDDPEWFG